MTGSASGLREDAAAAFRRGVSWLAAGALLALGCTTAAELTGGLDPAGPGSLQLTVHGLPAGANAVVGVTSSQGYQQQLSASTTLSGLPAGGYTIAAQEVTFAGDRYVPAPGSQLVSVAPGGVSSAQVVYALVSARLDLVVAGIPAGATASLTLTGPGGFAQSVSGSTLFSGLAPGAYQLVAGDLVWNADLYRGEPVEQSITLAGPSTVAVPLSVVYQLASGRLQLDIGGLPGAVAASVQVSGPGYSQSITASGVLTGLLPGPYTVSASPVSAGGSSYAPTPASTQVQVTASAVPVILPVSYAQVTGSLQVVVSGLPAGGSAAISVAGPAGFTQQVTGSALIAGLSPGTYSVSAALVSAGGNVYLPTPAAQTTVIGQEGGTETAGVSYTLAPASLTVSISGLPAGVAASLQVSGPAGYSESLSGSATLSGLAPGSYALVAQPVSGGGTSYLPAPAAQNVSVSAGATATAGVGYAPGGGGPSLDLSVHGAYFTQATQRYDGSVPLVAGRDAYLRVFALANEANSVQAQVRVRLYHGAALVQTYTINPPAGAVPQAADESALSKSWNLLVPGSLVVPGLRLLAEVDPAGGVAEGNEGNNQFPASGAPASVNVQALPTFALRFVPVLQQVNGLQGNVTSGNQESFLADLKKELPVGAYDVDIRAPYTTTAPALQGSNANGAWNTILSEVLALRAADASTRYYYGVVKVGYGSGVAGIGYVGGGARTALGWDYLPSGAGIMAHELGHNMGRMHAPCGGAAQPDPGYPYPGGQIGVWGLDLTTLALKAPTLPDLMTYCGPSWVSDYNWSAMVTYRQGGPNNAPEGGSGDGLLIWGRIGPTGVVLEPAFRVPLAGTVQPSPGPNLLELLGPDGAAVSRVGFEAPLLADLPGAERHFAFVVPMPGGAAPAGIRVVAGTRTAVRFRAGPGPDAAVAVSRPATAQLELRWDAARYPMVMVRDAAGRILSFARGGVARLTATGQDFDLQLSDGVGTFTRAARLLR